MADKKDNQNQQIVSPDMEKMRGDFQKSTGMKVVQTPDPPQGKTEFAKDKKQN